jgi:acyl-CoA hydrolase
VTQRAATHELQLAQVMLPEDANPLGNVHGGTLMKLADTAGGTCAMRHARLPTVTVVMDSMTFEGPVYVGNLVLLHAGVTWTGRTSIETEVTIDAEDILTGSVRRISTAYFVYVAIDEHGRPTPVRPLGVTTDEQRQRWQDAEQRRAARLRRPDGSVRAST